MWDCVVLYVGTDVLEEDANDEDGSSRFWRSIDTHLPKGIITHLKTNILLIFTTVRTSDLVQWSDCLSCLMNRWSRKGRRSYRQQARRCSWTRCGSQMQRARVGTTPQLYLYIQTLCNWTQAITSSTQTALQPLSRWDNLPRHCRMPSGPASSTASGPRYENTSCHRCRCRNLHSAFQIWCSRFKIRLNRCMCVFFPLGMMFFRQCQSMCQFVARYQRNCRLSLILMVVTFMPLVLYPRGEEFLIPTGQKAVWALWFWRCRQHIPPIWWYPLPRLRVCGAVIGQTMYVKWCDDNEWWVEKDLEASGHSLVSVLSQQLPQGSQGDH